MNTFRDMSLAILTDWQNEPNKLADIIYNRLESNRHGFSWRGDVSEMVFGTVRLIDPLDEVLSPKIKPSTNKMVRNILRLGTYELLEMTGKPDYATIHSWVETAKARVPFAKGMVNAVLQSIVREREKSLEILTKARKTNMPEWVLTDPVWINASKETQSQWSTYLSNRPEWFAVSGSELEDSLQYLEKSEFLPHGFKITNMADFLQTNDFKDGKLFVMDASSQLVAHYALDQNAKTQLDLCAAPGGKLMYSVWFAKNLKSVTAVDKNEQKLGKIRENLERIQVKIPVSLKMTDARHLKTDPADVVWIDAPCTGSGVINRKPDIRAVQSSDGLKLQQKLQSELLDHAATLVNPGGRLVYSTCSFLESENENQIRKFLETHPDFSVYINPDPVFAGMTNEFGLRTFPAQTQLDGASAFILIRKK